MKYPYDDSNMRYDYILHRYVLTKEGVFELLGINLDTQFNQFEPNARQSRAERFLKKVTNTVYDIFTRGVGIRSISNTCLQLVPSVGSMCRKCL